MKPTVEERFMKFVYPEPNSGCWLWGGSLNASGYGQFSVGRRPRLAHRVSYELANGEIKEGLPLDHLCRNRSCVNPDHLEPVTYSVNARRGARGGSVREDGTFQCKNCGSQEHYTAKSKTCVGGLGKWCVPCEKKRKAEYHAKNREARNAQSRAYHDKHREERNARCLARYYARKAANEQTSP